jgi:hypothetical protein
MSSQPHLQAVSNAFTGHADAPPTTPAPLSSSGGTSTTSGPPKNSAPKPAPKQRAEQALPTDRLNFDKQVQALRSVAQLSGNGRRPVTAEEQSSALGLKGNVGGLSNRFFKDSGWLESAGRGMYVPTEPLVRFHRHLGIQPDDLEGARAILAETVKSSWYWIEIGQMLEGDGILQSGVLHLLGNAAGAAPNHTPQLVLIIDWLVWLGLVVRDGDRVKLASLSESSEETAAERPVEDVATDAASKETPEEPTHHTPEEERAAQTARPTPVDVDALVSFNFSVRITADDAAKLTTDQLQTLLEFAEKLRS